MHPPGVKDRKRFYEANHIAFLANAKAIDSFRKHVPNGKIGPSFAYSPAYPSTSHPDDILAFENAEEFTNNWWLDVYCWAKYPQAPFDYLRGQGLAPTIEEGDFELLQKGAPDFVGVNYYHTLTYESNPLDGVSEGAFNVTVKRAPPRQQEFPDYTRLREIPIWRRRIGIGRSIPSECASDFVALQAATIFPYLLQRTAWGNLTLWNLTTSLMIPIELPTLILILRNAGRPSLTE